MNVDRISILLCMVSRVLSIYLVNLHFGSKLHLAVLEYVGEPLTLSLWYARLVFSVAQACWVILSRHYILSRAHPSVGSLQYRLPLPFQKQRTVTIRR